MSDCCKSKLWPVVLGLLLIGASGCVSTSGDAPDPIRSGGGFTTAAGGAAVSNEPIDSSTCEGVLAGPPDTHSLKLQSLTDSGQANSPGIDTMCAALYQTSAPGDPFLTVALINFEADRFAAAHYDLLKGAFVAQGITLSEVDSLDESSLDQFSALIDREGIGRTTVFRKTTWVVTLSIGPTTSASPWTARDIEAIGQSILTRTGRRTE
jgi:hypothetical protein